MDSSGPIVLFPYLHDFRSEISRDRPSMEPNLPPAFRQVLFANRPFRVCYYRSCTASALVFLLVMRAFDDTPMPDLIAGSYYSDRVHWLHFSQCSE